MYFNFAEREGQRFQKTDCQISGVSSYVSATGDFLLIVINKI